MQDTLDESLKRLKQTKKRNKQWTALLLILSLIVTLDVFWVLRQPGLTLAGDASCGILEHTHDDACGQLVCVCNMTEAIHTHEDSCYKLEITCGYEEHVHSMECYSDKTADVETQLDWQEMFADYPFTEDLCKDLAGIAQTQVGYSESKLNFEVDSDGVRRGYTRYGAWYGAPYSDWSAMFVSFCLHYAGADPEEYPGNTGTDAMAKAWDALGRYAPVGQYVPSIGDLVFFTDNTVGIITEVNSNYAYVIGGNISDAVRGQTLSLDDESIAGWGCTAVTIPVVPSEETDVPDISNGPTFFIFANRKIESQVRRFASGAVRTVTDLITYLEEHGGTHFFTLLDTNNRELPKDADGNYIVTAEINYKLTLTIANDNGFKPGTYQYHLPDGVRVNGGTGSFILEDGTNVGEWEVTDDGLITMVLNNEVNTLTEIAISGTMGIVFPQQDEPLDFDGKISVIVNPPPEENISTKLTKWGKQGEEGDEQNKTDASKLYWQIVITGREGSQIPGSVITDQLLAVGTQTGNSYYTAADMEAGIKIGISQPNPDTGEQLHWHELVVYPGDPNLSWTEDGWIYEIPEYVKCKWCPEPIELGNDGWIYYIDYTSTPDPQTDAGTLGYMNRVVVDGQLVESWADFTHEGENLPDVIKTGSFHGDADGGVFLWEFQVTVPAKRADTHASYYTTVIDNLRVKNSQGNTVGYANNDVFLAAITAAYNGERITVPHIDEADENDPFAWATGWSEDHGDGIYYSRGIYLLSRCHCSEETCHSWNAGGGYCDAPYWAMDEWGSAYRSDFCYCWISEEDVTFTFTYETNDPSVIDTFGGQGNELQNEVFLQQTDANNNPVPVGSAWANVPIPGVFKKELFRDFDYDGYTANYKITVNEAKLALTNGTPLTIHDEMSQTLTYISGSLVITSEDSNGNTAVLQQGRDYTVSYDGTGNYTDANGNPVHVLDIVIIHPQPVMYVLDYDTTLIRPAGAPQALKYSNTATVSLWGKAMTDETEEKVYANINIASKSYKVEMYKTCAVTGEPLGGAAFGLFNEHGGLIDTDVTDSNGELLFQSNIIEGIVLREHQLYYMQEQKAPPGYRLDDTKYWFCFCNNTSDSCSACDEIMAGVNGFRIPFSQIGKVHAENQLISYDLPATGGFGAYPIVWASVVFIVIPLVYRFIRRCKQKRRGVG